MAGQLVDQLEGHPETPFLRSAAEARKDLIGVMGFEPPSWQAVSDGARPPFREPEDVEPGTVRRGWQHEACSRVERQCKLWSGRKEEQEPGRRCPLFPPTVKQRCRLTFPSHLVATPPPSTSFVRTLVGRLLCTRGKENAETECNYGPDERYRARRK